MTRKKSAAPALQLNARETALYDALCAAERHLSYCGYGDSWERECAVAEELEKRILAALQLCEPPLNR